MQKLFSAVRGSALVPTPCDIMRFDLDVYLRKTAHPSLVPMGGTCTPAEYRVPMRDNRNVPQGQPVPY